MINNQEEQLKFILERNARVEADKSWEVSNTRRFSIAVITYIVAGFYISTLGANLPWLNALIPVGGFMLSTLSLPKIKEIWLNKYCTNTKGVENNINKKVDIVFAHKIFPELRDIILNEAIDV